MAVLLSILETILPFIDFGRFKISTKLDYIEFFKPIVGRVHWSEENYDNSPLNYRMKCKVILFNGKKKVRGINNCSFSLNYKNGVVQNEVIDGDFDILLNIPSGEIKEIEIYQEGILFLSENLKNGYTLTFNYYVNGKKNQKDIEVKSI